VHEKDAHLERKAGGKKASRQGKFFPAEGALSSRRNRGLSGKPKAWKYKGGTNIGEKNHSGKKKRSAHLIRRDPARSKRLHFGESPETL